MVKVPDGNTCVPCRYRVLAVALLDCVLGRHLACRRELDRGGHVDVQLIEDGPERVKDGRQADFRMAIARCDSRLRALWPGQKRPVNLLGELPDGFMVEAAERNEAETNFFSFNLNALRADRLGQQIVC